MSKRDGHIWDGSGDGLSICRFWVLFGWPLTLKVL